MHVANALVGFLFAASGPLAIILAAGTKGGLSEADLASWVFGSLAVNGVVSIVFCLRLSPAAGVLLDHPRHGPGRAPRSTI